MRQTTHPAEAALARAREELLRGNAAAVMAAAGHLGNAVALLRRKAVTEPAPLYRIRGQVSRLAALLESARAFHAGLARLHSREDNAVANYTRSGKTCSPAAASSLTTHG